MKGLQMKLKFNVNTKENVRKEFDDLMGRFLEDHSVEGVAPVETVIAMFEAATSVGVQCKALLEDRGASSRDLNEAEETMRKKAYNEGKDNIDRIKAMFPALR